MARQISARRGLWAGTAIAAVLTIGAGVGGAAAQTAQTTDQSQAAPAARGSKAVQSTPEIVVTGSRLINRGYKAPTPVTTVSAQDLKLSGTQNVETYLGTMPQVVGSQNSGPTANTVPGGTALVNLRGFGEQRNLVLVNGRRYTIDGPEQVTDLNTIPSALVDRVEVVTGGSSAVYGSDAITGVVNFILKDNFQGGVVSAQNSVDQHTGSPDYNFDLTIGNNFADGRGNISASFDYMKREGYTQSQRGGWADQSLSDGCVTASSWSSTSAGTPMAVPSGQTCLSSGGRPGLVYAGSNTIPNGRFTAAGFGGSNTALNSALAAAGLPGLSSLGFTFNNAGSQATPMVDPADEYNLSPFAYLIVPQERRMANVFAHYDFDPKVTGYVEMHYSTNDVQAQLAPTSVSGNFLVNDNNPYLSPQMQAVLGALDASETGTTTVTEGTSTLTTNPNDGLAELNVNRRLPELGPRTADDNLTAYRMAMGFKGDLGSVSDDLLANIHYDTYFTYARTTETDFLGGAVSLSAFQRGLLSVGGAAPLIDPFGQNLTPAAIKSIEVSATNFTDTDQEVLAANLNGELIKDWAGPVDFNTGVEWRRDASVYRPDSYLSTGDLSGFNASDPTAGSESVGEIYGELRVPLLADLPFAKRLTVNSAFRYSDYDLKGVGGVWTYSAGGEWAPFNDVTFRGQYQRAVRAPNVGELYGGQTTTGPSLTDPCSSRASTAQQTAAVRALCIATGVPAADVFTFNVQPNQFIDTVAGGNPNLHAETSNTFTYGAVITPRWIPRLALSVDYFNIDLSGAIAPLGSGAQNVLNLCYYTVQQASSSYCQAIHRDPTTGEIAAPSYITTINTNIGGIQTAGVDFDGSYALPVSWGLFSGGSRFTLETDLTYTHDFTLTPSQDLPGERNYCVGSFGQTCGQPIPRWKGQTRLTWANGPLTLSVAHRFIGSVTVDTYILPSREGNGSTAPALNSLTNPIIPLQNYIDVSGTYDFGQNKRYQISGGVKNLCDVNPPVVGTPAPSDNTFAATYDIEGRVFFMGASVRF